MYTEEELLEAVDILVEDYGIDEDEAIELVSEAYEDELEQLSEAMDILVEGYGFDEDYAFDLIMEAYDDEEERGEGPQERTTFGDEMRKEWDNCTPQEKAVLRNTGRGAVVGGALVGGALALRRAKKNHDRRKERKELKLSHKRQLEYIAKTGKRMNESVSSEAIKQGVDRIKPYDDESLTKGERNFAYGTGIAMGALVAGGGAALRSYGDKRRHNKKMNKLRKKYSRIEDREKEKYKIRNLRGE